MLTAGWLARQARTAHGPLGRVFARLLSWGTWPENAEALRALALRPTDKVLEAGFGDGQLFRELVRAVPQGQVHGLDPSGPLVAAARRRHAPDIANGRVRIELGLHDEIELSAIARQCGWASAESTHKTIRGTEVVFFKAVAPPAPSVPGRRA